ncbi:MAG: C4-type zinc ribbon domain-containing protein [Acidimicrobiia bacterium]
MTGLESLAALQERDLALDRLRHRLETLPERDEVAAGEARRASLDAEAAQVRARRDEAAAEEKRFDDEARLLGDQAMAAEAKLYGGEVTSPKELQALQADVTQLKRHQSQIEDRQLGAMEIREPLDAQLVDLDATLATIDAELATSRDALTAAEVALTHELSDEGAARGEVAGGIDAALLAAYEDRRVKAKGVGAAKLIGMTCSGCHLTIPATEVDRIRKATPDSIEYCDNCGCILIA